LPWRRRAFCITRWAWKAIGTFHDTFHVVALASRAIGETRKDLVRDLQGEEGQVIKGTKFLLLQGKENLDDDGLTRLAKLMDAKPLCKVYLLKGDLWPSST
jgi:hypothetical protein